MPITTFSSRQFSQDASKAKKAAEAGPVIITDRGRPAHVLLTFDEYRRLRGGRSRIADLLATPGIEDIEIDIVRIAELKLQLLALRLCTITDTGDFQHGYVRELFGVGQFPAASCGQAAFVFHFFEYFLEPAFLLDIEFERSGNFTFADMALSVANKIGDLLLAWEGGVGHCSKVSVCRRCHKGAVVW